MYRLIIFYFLTISSSNAFGQTTDNVDSILNVFFDAHKNDTLFCLTVRDGVNVPFRGSTLGRVRVDVVWRKAIYYIDRGHLYKELFSKVFERDSIMLVQA